MRRRRVLTVGTLALAGCVARPSPTAETEAPPNFFASYTPTDDGYTITFEYGTPLTEQNTEKVSVTVTGPSENVQHTWASNTDADAKTTFPLEPGATIDVPTPAESTIRIIWLASSGGLSATLDSFDHGNEDNDTTDNRSTQTEPTVDTGDEA